MDRLEFLERQCRPLEDEVRKNAMVNEDVRLLMTIRGLLPSLLDLKLHGRREPVSVRRPPSQFLRHNP